MFHIHCRIKVTLNNKILCTSTPCYHIASLNCDDLSNCVARWQQRFIPRCKHSNNDNRLAAGTTFVGSKLLVLHIMLPESNEERQGAGNERERPISYRIASCNGDDDLSCQVAPMAATIAFHVTRTYHIALISYCITRWRQQQQSGCSNNICWQHASRPSYRVAQKQRRTARK